VAKKLWYPQKQKFEVTTDAIDEDLILLEELLQEEMYEKSQKSLYQFIINFWNCHEPSPLKANWHMECIAEHVQAAINREVRRLIINVPPRSGKSIITSISAPCWSFIDRPFEKFWLISHSAKLFMQNIVLARRILEHPQYKDRWCNRELEDYYKFSIADDVNLKTRVETNRGGYILGGSPTSTALGMGYSVAILDDVLDSEESNSPAAIQKVNDWYTQTFLNRSNDPKTDVVIMIQQRLHQNDLTNYAKTVYEDAGWTHVILPAKYEPSLTFLSPIGYNDKRTKRNQLLDPERLPDEFLAAQSKNKVVYNTRYQQNPDADGEGNLLAPEWLKEVENRPRTPSLMITVWDLSFTDSPTSSYSVGLVLAKQDGYIYIIDMLRKQLDIPAQVDAIRHMRAKYPKAIVGVEKRANGHAVMSLLEREIKDIYAFEPRLFGGSKEQRLGATLQYFRDGKVLIYSPFKEDTKLENTYSVVDIKKELLSFPLGTTDDIVDCVSYGIQYLMEKEMDSMAVITKGERIIYSQDDITDKNILRADYNNAAAFERESNFLEIIPDRDYLTGINW
jgi:hypothetical protein